MTKALIIGGTSGLGLELAELLAPDYDVYVSGRRELTVPDIQFFELELNTDSLAEKLDEVVENLPPINLFIYAAGFYQEAPLRDLSDSDLEKMYRIGLQAPTMLLARILRKQEKLPGFTAITSTSQWTPRPLEPMYTATKAGLGMLANSVSKDEQVGKVLVVGPAAMNTHFWETARDPDTVLNPGWVAEQILKEWEGEYEYKLIRVLREPARVEIAEVR